MDHPRRLLGGYLLWSGQTADPARVYSGAYLTRMPAGLLEGVYRLVSANGGKALDNGNVTIEGNAVIQYTSNSGTSQQWAMTKIG